MDNSSENKSGQQLYIFGTLGLSASLCFIINFPVPRIFIILCSSSIFHSIQQVSKNLDLFQFFISHIMICRLFVCVVFFMVLDWTHPFIVPQRVKMAFDLEMWREVEAILLQVALESMPKFYYLLKRNTLIWDEISLNSWSIIG